MTIIHVDVQKAILHDSIENCFILSHLASALTLTSTKYEPNPEFAFKGYGSNLSPYIEICL